MFNSIVFTAFYLTALYLHSFFTESFLDIYTFRSYLALGFQPATFCSQAHEFNLSSVAAPSASCFPVLSPRLWWDVLLVAQSSEGRLSLTRRLGPAVSAAKTVPFNIVLSSSMLCWHTHTHTGCHTYRQRNACTYRHTAKKVFLKFLLNSFS